MDNHTPEQRRKNMQAIKSRDTKIECMLRKELWHRGYRYRKNYKKLIGKPDIVITKYKIAIFCDSEFWHGKDYKESACRIETNSDYWKKKIRRNIERDIEVNEALKTDGWIVVRFWSKDILKDVTACADEIINIINCIRNENGID